MTYDNVNYTRLISTGYINTLRLKIIWGPSPNGAAPNFNCLEPVKLA